MSVRPESESMRRNPPMTDHVMSTIAVQSITARIAKRGMTFDVR
jgi:hypothetical protein